MQAGLASKCLGFRDIFTARVRFVSVAIMVLRLTTHHEPGELTNRAA